MSTDLKQATSHVMLAYGGVLDLTDTNFKFGDKYLPFRAYDRFNGFTIDKQAHAALLFDVETYGLDYENCSEPVSDTAEEFNGTFTGPLWVPYLHATLVTGCGSKFQLAVKVPDENFYTALKAFLNAQDLPTALATAKKRHESKAYLRPSMKYLA